MSLSRGVNEATSEEAESARSEASQLGADVFILATKGASTRADFFEQVKKSLPLDPPLLGSRSWDALADSLWAGIDSLDATVVVIIWTGASDLRRDAPDDFTIAMTVFRDLTESLGKWTETYGEPKEVCVYVS